VISLKSLALSVTVVTGIAFAIPATGQAMPVDPVKIQAATSNNIVDVRHKKWRKHAWRSRHHRRWARYCDPWDGCYRRHRHARFYRYYDEPYYDYGYPYYGGYYGPGFYGPSIGLQFRID
jgi:hypothetical protein